MNPMVMPSDTWRGYGITAERALTALRKLAAAEAHVIRDGSRQV